MMDYLEQGGFTDTGRETELDGKKRITLGSVVDQPTAGLRYRVLKNRYGQILLDPIKSVPPHEAWIYEQPERIASLQRGIEQAEAGKVLKIEPSEAAD
jgi:hypothetical protein